MATIGGLAKRFGLSRSTLLYYDSIELLRPTARTAKKYRVYTEEDARRLELVCQYRRAGIALGDIRKMLDGPGSRLTEVLERRLADLNDEMQRLREQQRVVVGMLENRGRLGRVRIMNRERWISLLRAAGFDEEQMKRWHADFEADAPREHQEFLEILCFSDSEIRRIRRRSLALSRRLRASDPATWSGRARPSQKLTGQKLTASNRRKPSRSR